MRRVQHGRPRNACQHTARLDIGHNMRDHISWSQSIYVLSMAFDVCGTGTKFLLLTVQFLSDVLVTHLMKLVAQLLSYPVGRLWARYMPRKTIFGVQLNPGPFNVKEHVIITIMAVVGGR